jgi:hypothetical protein
MEPYGVSREIDSDVMFAARFDGFPPHGFGASTLFQLAVLVR